MILPPKSRAILALIATLISFSTASAEEVVRINGTGAGLVLAKPLIAAFQKQNRGIGFQMEKSLGSAASLKAVAHGAIDIAIAGRALKPHEMVPQLSWVQYGRTPYAVVTNGTTKVKNVTSAELAAMFSGTIATWPNGELVRVILRPKEDIDTKVLRQLSPEMDQAVTAAHARKDMLLGITDQEAFEFLKKTQGSAGFVPLAMPLSEPGTANVASFNGVEPTLANLASGKYPHAKDIYLVTRKDAPPAVRKFVEFMNSRKGAAIARKAGFLTSSK